MEIDVCYTNDAITVMTNWQSFFECCLNDSDNQK